MKTDKNIPEWILIKRKRTFFFLFFFLPPSFNNHPSSFLIGSINLFRISNQPTPSPNRCNKTYRFLFLSPSLPRFNAHQKVQRSVTISFEQFVLLLLFEGRAKRGKEEGRQAKGEEFQSDGFAVRNHDKGVIFERVRMG